MRIPSAAVAASLACTLGGALASCSSRGRSSSMHAMSRAGVPAGAAGVAAFAFDDFGGLSGATLETNGLPYKLVAAALIMDEETRAGRALGRDALGAIYRRFGFLTPARVENWPAMPRPAFDRPLGVVSGIVRGPTPFVRVDAANIGCAACHAGTTYDRDGRPTGNAWLGLPSTSINLEGYTRAVYAALQRAAARPDSVRRRVEALFPEMSWRERFTMRRLLLPRARKRLAELSRGIDAPSPFSNGGPGLTNGVASIKLQLGLLDRARVHPEHAFTSIPDLAWRGARTALLYDGVYAPPGAARFAPRAGGATPAGHLDSLAAIVAYFTVPTMGMDPRAATAAIPRVREVMRWLDRTYAPPAFPGPVDAAHAAAGRALFEQRCADCHGRYADGPPPRRVVWFPNRLVPQAEMGTDSARWAAVTDALTARIAGTVMGRYVDARRTRGYVAPILSGVWATAPYLHNGSVPTLWQLLTPDERPARFEVGGHRLDFASLGIAGAVGADGVYRYPADHAPWSAPELYDTREPGRGNRGHEREAAGLTAGQKRALIEYLKTL